MAKFRKFPRAMPFAQVDEWRPRGRERAGHDTSRPPENRIYGRNWGTLLTMMSMVNAWLLET